MNADGPVKILVIERGWVLVGHWQQVGDVEVLQGARCIRRWGTSKGIGELVQGPLDSTSLDPIGEVEVPTRQVIFRVPVDVQKWSDHLG